MLIMRTRLALATAILACAAITPAAAKRLQLTQLHYQYFDAIQKGDIPRARELAQLGKIDPNNIGGAPLVSSLFSNGMYVPMSLALLSDQSFDYVFKELKQPFNAPLQPDQDRTVFSLMCMNFEQARGFQGGTVQNVFTTVARIRYAFSQGADPRALSNIPDHMRKNQPFPACVSSYLNYRKNLQVRGAILSVLKDYLEKGADPDYEQPVSLAAENYDAQLLTLLAEHHANTGRVFRVREMPVSCTRGSGLTSVTKQNTTDLDTILGRLPYPKDADTELARDFLATYIELGGDITEKLHRFGGDGLHCEHTTQTLFEKAVSAGQLTYAKMVQELEKMPRVPKAQPAAIPPPPPPAAPLTGSRITTASINVRQQPSMTGTLVSTLGPNIVFNIEETSPDRQWTLINADTIVRGWANTAVILKSSAPNAPAANSSAAHR